MPDPDRALDQEPGTPCPVGQRHAGVMAAPDGHRRRIVQLADRELDVYRAGPAHRQLVTRLPARLTRLQALGVR
jgi:hypothetical protein